MVLLNSLLGFEIARKDLAESYGSEPKPIARKFLAANYPKWSEKMNSGPNAQFLIAKSFSKSLSRLTAQEQSVVKITVFDLQQNPSSPGLKFHRVSGLKESNFWSVRCNQDIRVIVHKTSNCLLLAYVGHHDDAYKWAEKRRIESHPKTGAAQIVEIRERVEEISTPTYDRPPQEQTEFTAKERDSAPLFTALSNNDLLSIGVPNDWIEDVKKASEDGFFDISDHIPSEAAEALLEYATTGQLKVPNSLAESANPFTHPDAQRRFRVLEGMEELQRALEYPWDQWAIFLHPSQRDIVELQFKGPARVSGSAGTGKTVVALHRAARTLKTDKAARVLITTFSTPLSNTLKTKLKSLTAVSTEGAEATILPFQEVASELFTLAFGYSPRVATQEQIEAFITSAVESLQITEFTTQFALSEWLNVVDPWQIETLDAYASVPRLGRKSRLGSKQRERLWPIFTRARENLEDQGLQSWPSIFGKVTKHFSSREHKPFTHIIVDEAQDLGVPEFRMLAAIARNSTDALFFAGDLGQRIFQEPFSWKGLGIDVRGRSKTLKVNYRTSHQIRRTVDELLPHVIRDVDGNEEDRRDTVSVFNGPNPEQMTFDDANIEGEAVSTWVASALKGGIAPEEIGIFVRSEKELGRARKAIQAAGQMPLELSEQTGDRTGRISMGTMHLAKGLEFKAVAVMACDDGVLPNHDRISSVVDEDELDQVYETERHLFYVACTRARDRLLVTGVAPASEFFDDLSTNQQ